MFGVQSNRMSGDTHQTGYNTATPHSSRSMADDEKETGKLRYYRKYDWLLGNNAFMEPTKANIRPTPPVTGIAFSFT